MSSYAEHLISVEWMVATITGIAEGVVHPLMRGHHSEESVQLATEWLRLSPADRGIFVRRALAALPDVSAERNAILPLLRELLTVEEELLEGWSGR